MSSGRRRSALFACAVVAMLALAGPPRGAFAVDQGPAHQMPLTPHMPSTAVHTEFLVEVNKKGQVTRVRSGKECTDLAFNAMTYGNALQAFIRTADGKSIPGTYRLSYDYDPKTTKVRRSVAIVRAGGVDPNRLGAVDEMAIIAKRHKGASPAPSLTGSPLPVLKQITGHKH